MVVQRVTYRRRKSFNTKSNKIRKVKTPGGKLVVHYVGKRGKGPQCGDAGCTKRLHGVSSRPRGECVCTWAARGGVGEPRGRGPPVRRDGRGPQVHPAGSCATCLGGGGRTRTPTHVVHACLSRLGAGAATGPVQPHLQAPEERVSCLWRLAVRRLRAPAVRPPPNLTPSSPAVRCAQCRPRLIFPRLATPCLFQDCARVPH